MAPRERSDAGLTLIEVVVAFVILSIVLVPIALLLTNVLGQSATARDKLTALSLAEQCLEKLNNTGPTLADGVPDTDVPILEDSHCFGASGTSPVVESTMSYEVHAEFTWETAQGNHPDLCKSSVTATLIEAQVWTTWAHTQKVTDTTLLDYPPPSLPDDGFLAVEVYGTPDGTPTGTPAGLPPVDASGRSWSTRVQLVPVTITRSGFSVTAYPNSYGCVFEEVPAPDSYTVTAYDPTVGSQRATPAWTSTAEKTKDTPVVHPVAVDLDTVTHVTLRYDEGLAVSLHYPSTTATEGPAICPAAGQLECVVFGQAPTASATPAEKPAAELSVLDRTTKKWSVTQLSGAARLTALACAGTSPCIAVGYAGTAAPYTGVSFSSGTSATPSFTGDTVPSGVSALSGITCPSATRCYAWGIGSSGAVILTGNVVTGTFGWRSTADTLATVPARVTALACWSSTRCYALGTKSATTKPVLLSLSTTTSLSHTWITDTPPTTPPLTLTQLACPAATTCYAVGTRKTTHGDVVSLSKTTGRKWTTDTLPTTVTVLSQLTCPSGTACFAIGTRKTGTSSDGAIVSLTAATSWKLDTLEATGSITAITCPPGTSSGCLAMGTTSTGTPVLLWRAAGTSTFTAESLPSSVAGLSAITCASGSHCFAIGTSSAGAAVLLSGTTTWRLDTLPATPSPTAFFGLACGGTACTAPGATETAAVYLDGTPTGTAWSNATPSGAEGMYIGGVPIAVTSSGLETTPVEVTVPSGTTAVSRTPSLFPFSSGYHVAATECKPLPAWAQVSSTPGATPTATMPMGLLSLRVVNKYGDPDSGATVSASLFTSSACAELAAPTGKTNPASFTLEPTGPLGLSQVDVPYGSYKITVTHTTAITKVTVTPTSVKVTTVTHAVGTPLVVTFT